MSTVLSMLTTDELSAADVAPGQLWRHDTCPPDERVFTWRIMTIMDERVWLQRFEDGDGVFWPLAETTLGHLLAYWVPVEL